MGGDLGFAAQPSSAAQGLTSPAGSPTPDGQEQRRRIWSSARDMAWTSPGAERPLVSLAKKRLFCQGQDLASTRRAFFSSTRSKRLRTRCFQHVDWHSLPGGTCPADAYAAMTLAVFPHVSGWPHPAHASPASSGVRLCLPAKRRFRCGADPYAAALPLHALVRSRSKHLIQSLQPVLVAEAALLQFSERLQMTPVLFGCFRQFHCVIVVVLLFQT